MLPAVTIVSRASHGFARVLRRRTESNVTDIQDPRVYVLGEDDDLRSAGVEQAAHRWAHKVLVGDWLADSVGSNDTTRASH